MATVAPLFVFEHVGCGHDAGMVVDDVDLAVHAGEFVGIVGPSGTGKTTVLKALLGIVPTRTELRWTCSNTVACRWCWNTAATAHTLRTTGRPWRSAPVAR